MNQQAEVLWRGEVPDDDAGSRLDVFLVRHVQGMSRAKAKLLLDAGKVRVNGRRRRKGSTVAPGEEVTLEALPVPGDFAARHCPDAELVVIYEDADLVVVNKPAGMPSHPLHPDEGDTLAGALVARYPEMAEIGYARREPGILHRLDTDTSGVLVAARDRHSFERLREDLRGGNFDKRYVALCAGEVAAPAEIDLPIANDPQDKARVVACADEEAIIQLGPLPALTEVLESRAFSGDDGAFSLVTVRASVARRHQIRAHLAALGHPLAGDRTYEGPSLPHLNRHFLHASHVAFPHPKRRRMVRVDAVLPEDLSAPLGALRAVDG